MGNNWSPDRKFWRGTFFTYNSHTSMALFVTLHARKVLIEELKRLQTAFIWKDLQSYTVVRR